MSAPQGRSGGPCLAALACALVLAAGGGVRAQEAGIALNAAGDIADCRLHGARHTAALLDRLDGAILALGDLAYDNGTEREFRLCYEPTWGRHKARTRPVPGNHEYGTAHARDYFAYWGARAGAPDRGYYSFELGDWHIVALNSNIDARRGSAQDRWLAGDLEGTGAACILAFWHHPVFSSGRHGNDPRMFDLYRRLHENGASVVLAGHDHVYERFAPQDPEGRADLTRGVRAFTVGTGGARRYEFREIRPNSEARYNEAWGVLRLRLLPKAYRWSFITADGDEIDTGDGACTKRERGAR